MTIDNAMNLIRAEHEGAIVRFVRENISGVAVARPGFLSVFEENHLEVINWMRDTDGVYHIRF